MGTPAVLPLPALQGHPADPQTDYRELPSTSPTVCPNRLLLMVTKGTAVIPVPVAMLARALAVMLQLLGLDTALYALNSLRRRGRGWGVPPPCTGQG